jgi:hypothetical protein
VSDSWRQAYAELKEYTANNPQINIRMSVIVIPEDIRHEFYRLFDAARLAFLKEKGQALLDEAAPLSSNYARAAQEVTKSLGLSEIKVEAGLSWFLNDPENGLIRPLSDPLFDLLKGKIDINTFEGDATESIRSSFGQLFTLGYERWVVLSLVNLLAPDRAVAIPIETIRNMCWELEADEKTGLSEKPVPGPEKMEHLSLEHEWEPAFIISNLIVHSTKLNRYVSITADLDDAMWTADGVSDKREWQRLRELGMLYTPVASWPNLVIHIDDQPEDIALVADFSRFCRPDIVVECMEQADWYQKGGLDRVKQNHAFLKPKLGTYVVSRLPVPEEAFKDLIPEPAAGEPASEQKIPPQEQPLDIHILTVSYDQSRLAPIIDTLSPNREAAGETDGQ